MALLGATSQVEGVLRLGVDILTVVGVRTEERAILLLRHLGEALVEHHADHRLGIVLQQVVHGLLGLVVHGVMLHGDGDAALLQLLVLVEDIDGLVVVGHGHIDDGRGVLELLHVAPETLDLGLGMIDIDVTDDDDGLVAWVIPLVIVVAELIVLEVVYHRHQTDGQTLAILRTRILKRKRTLEDTHRG